MFSKNYNEETMDYISMGRRIKDIRTKNKITQEKLAEKTGLSTAHISNIETAHTKASLASLVKIANALSASLDDILCDSVENKMLSVSKNAVNGLGDCNMSEVRIINDTLATLKKSLIKNRK